MHEGRSRTGVRLSRVPKQSTTYEAFAVAAVGDIRLYGLPHTGYDLRQIAEESVSPGLLRPNEDNANEVLERNSGKALKTGVFSRID